MRQFVICNKHKVWFGLIWNTNLFFFCFLQNISLFFVFTISSQTYGLPCFYYYVLQMQINKFNIRNYTSHKWMKTPSKNLIKDLNNFIGQFIYLSTEILKNCKYFFSLCDLWWQIILILYNWEDFFLHSTFLSGPFHVNKNLTFI